MNLGSKAVAYLNVDCAVQGPGFYGTATPQLDDLLLEVTKKVEKLLLSTVREKYLNCSPLEESTLFSWCYLIFGLLCLGCDS